MILTDIEGIIFDLDGVLVHTDELHYKAWKSVANRINISFDYSTNNRLRGVSRMESLDIILESSKEKLSTCEKEVLAEEKNALYCKYLKFLTPEAVEPKIRKMLHSLKDRGYKLAIGSSSKNAEVILKNIKLFDLFDAISDGNNIVNSKPHPEVFLKAAQFIMLTPNKCVVVEDAKAGVDAAIAGGFICFGVGDAATYNKATYKLKSLNQLGNYLK